MNQIFRMFFIIMVAVLLVFCSSLKAKKSLEDLRTAFNSESTSAEKYAKFGQAAMNEGYDTLAQLFIAVSKSERIHAMNFGKVIEKFGLDCGNPEIGNFEVKSTIENLRAGIRTETFEMQTVYPSFIRTAEREKTAEIARTFTWASNCEKKHLKCFRNAAIIIDRGSEKGIPNVWLVCSICGNIYSSIDLPVKCEYCLTKQENFIGYSRKSE
ncbi:MAG: rubrerythrin family protein [Mariniphaga sp.]